jgi:hypothetical protein
VEASFPPVGEGPYDGGMEARAARLEAGMSDIKATLARLEPLLSQVSKDLADIRTKDSVELKVAVAKLEGPSSQLPTTVRMMGFIFVVPAVTGVTRYLGV